MPEFKYPYLPGLLLGADPVNAGAQVAENIELVRLGELDKRGGFRRVNHRRYEGAIVCIPDLQRICDYRKLLVMSGYPEIPGTPAPIFEHDERGGDGGGGGSSPEPLWDENYPPIALGTAVPSSGLDPLLVQFTGSASWDPDGTIVAYHWDFGDGNTADIADPQHTYAAAGNYTATLTVTDNGGKTATDTIPIQVTATDPWSLDATFGAIVGIGVPATIYNGNPVFCSPLSNPVLRMQTAPGVWTTLGAFDANRTVEQVSQTILGIGTDLFVACRRTSDNRYYVYRWNGTGWSVEFNTAPLMFGRYGMLVYVGGSLYYKIADQGPVHTVVRERTGVATWTNRANTNYNNDPCLVDGINGHWHAQKCYGTKVGNDLILTTIVGPTINPGGHDVAYADGKMWCRSANANTLQYKSSDAGPWVNDASWPTVAPRCVFGDGGSNLYATIGAANTDVYRYSSGTWAVDRTFTGRIVAGGICTSSQLLLYLDNGEVWRREL